MEIYFEKIKKQFPSTWEHTIFRFFLFQHFFLFLLDDFLDVSAILYKWFPMCADCSNTSKMCWKYTKEWIFTRLQYTRNSVCDEWSCSNESNTYVVVVVYRHTHMWKAFNYERSHKELEGTHTHAIMKREHKQRARLTFDFNGCHGARRNHGQYSPYARSLVIARDMRTKFKFIWINTMKIKLNAMLTDII